MYKVVAYLLQQSQFLVFDWLFARCLELELSLTIIFATAWLADWFSSVYLECTAPFITVAQWDVQQTTS